MSPSQGLPLGSILSCVPKGGICRLVIGNERWEPGPPKHCELSSPAVTACAGSWNQGTRSCITFWCREARPGGRGRGSGPGSVPRPDLQRQEAEAEDQDQGQYHGQTCNDRRQKQRIRTRVSATARPATTGGRGGGSGPGSVPRPDLQRDNDAGTSEDGPENSDDIVHKLLLGKSSKS